MERATGRAAIDLTVLLTLFTAMATAGLSGCGMLGRFDRDPSLQGYTQIRFSDGRRASPLAMMDPEWDEDSAEPKSQFEAMALGGGLMIYLHGINGNLFTTNFFLPDEFANPTFYIPNGDYLAYAIGYTAMDFSGTVKCGLGDSGAVISLTGGAKTIDLPMNNATCGNASFTDTNYIASDQFKTLTLVSCTSAGLDAVSGSGSVCSGGNLGNIASVRVGLPIFTGSGGPLADMGGGTYSACINLASGTVATSLRLPVGSAGGSPPIFTRIDAHGVAGCAGSYLGSYDFHTGILNTNTVQLFDPAKVPINLGGSSGAKIYFTGTETKLFLRNIQ